MSAQKVLGLFLLNAGLVFLCSGFSMAVPAPAPAPAVKITKANYTAANGNNPPKADPQGTWGKPAKDGVDWKVSWDYGTKAGTGEFKLDVKIGEGGTTKVLPEADATGTWGPIGAENLQNPLPANTVIRARLQRLENSKWVDKATDYMPLPPP